MWFGGGDCRTATAFRCAGIDEIRGPGTDFPDPAQKLSRLIFLVEEL